MLHKGAWVATPLGTNLGVQEYKKVNFPGRDNSSLAAKGLKICRDLFKFLYSYKKAFYVQNENEKVILLCMTALYAALRNISLNKIKWNLFDEQLSRGLKHLFENNFLFSF